MMRPLSFAGVMTLSTLAFALPAMAAVAVPGYSFSGGFDTVGNASSTIGFHFYVTQAMTVTQLGFVDVGGDGLSGARAVGLWNNSGGLLASATVPAGTGGTLVGQFRYVPIAPIPLDADTAYWIGGRPGDEAYVNGVSQTSAPQLLVVDAGYTFFKNGADLTFPNGTITGGSAAVSNFQFTVPEPASLTMLGLGGLGLLRRRR